MSALGDIGDAIGDVAKAIADTLVRLAKAPWELEKYLDSVGAPPFDKKFVDKLKGIKQDHALDVKDAIALVEGLKDAYDAVSNTDDDAGTAMAVTEATIRVVLPIALFYCRRWGSGGQYALAAVIALVDDKLSEQLTGFTPERLLKVGKGALRSAREDQQSQIFIPMLGPLAAFALCKLQDLPEPMLTGGWESDLPVKQYGEPEPKRTTPIWMAQRTSSVKWTTKKKFQLARYEDPPLESPDAWSFGFTTVPVPGPSAEVPGTSYPAMWLQFDGDLSRDIDLGAEWKLRVRGHAGGGFSFSLVDDATVPGAGGGFEAELSWTPLVEAPEPKATPEGGESGGAAVSLGGASLILYGAGGLTMNGSAPDDYGFGVRLSKLRIALAPKSTVLKTLIRGSLTTSLDLGLFYSRRLGLIIEGGSGLDLYLSIRRSIGGGWIGATLSYLRISAIIDKKPERTRLGLQATLGLELSFLRATLILDGLGAGVISETNQPEGNLFGLADLKGDLIAPTGIGVKLDWGPIKGGGFFAYDKAKDRYSGAVEVGIGKNWVLRGVGFTEPRAQGSNETTTLITATIERDIPSPGFTISGIGFLFGLHRRANADAMREALPTGAIEAVLFPSDPLGRSAELVNSLATMFPPAPLDDDSHVFGLLLKGSFAGGKANVRVGFIFEFGRGSRTLSRVLVPFSLTAGPGGKTLSKVWWIEVLGLGDYDPASGDLEIRAVLRNSHICGGDLVGGLVVFHGDPDPSDADRSRGTFVSIGGYHPSYYAGKGPRRARVEDRLRLVIARGESVRLEVSVYLAFTPSGIHLGFAGRLVAQAAGFGVDGKLWLDGVTNYTFDDFTLDVGGSVELILFGRTVAGLELTGELQGQSPWRISGSVGFKVAWWTVSKSFSKELSDEEVDASAAAAAVHEQMAAALRDPLSYPQTVPGAVMLTKAPRDGVWNAPEQPLTLVQKIAPFETPIDRVGRTPLGAPTTIHIDSVAIDTSAPAHDLVKSEFAPAAYLSLDADAAVRAPVAELWPAGFAAGDVVVAGDDAPVAAKLDEITVDRAQLEPEPKRVLVFPVQILDAWRKQGVRATLQPIHVQPARFASRAGDAPTTFGLAWAMRGTLMRRTEGE